MADDTETDAGDVGTPELMSPRLPPVAAAESAIQPRARATPRLVITPPRRVPAVPRDRPAR